MASACGVSDRGADEVLVGAAASLTNAFGDIGETFTDAHPDIAVTFAFAASSELATQVLDGAPIDVLASADSITMDRLTGAGATGDDPVVFARNRPMIAVAAGNPLGITGVADLAERDLVLVVCAPEAPCGRYATAVFASAGVTPEPDSFEANVRAVLTKVTLGEADAGIVYATDVIAAGDDVTGIDIPTGDGTDAGYPIVVTAEGTSSDGAQTFVDFVLGPTGRSILERHGFTTP